MLFWCSFKNKGKYSDIYLMMSVKAVNLTFHSSGTAPSWSPGAARQPTRELMSTTHTYPWLIPIITWCWQFPSLSTNSMLIKSKLKLQSRAIVVGVAISPRNLGGKYGCRPHPRWRKCTRQFFSGNQSVSIELHHSGVVACMATTSSIVVCLKARFLWHTVLSNENGEFYTYLHISLLEQVGMSFNGIAYMMKVYPLFKREFPRVLMTWRTARARISNVRSPM